MLYPAYVVDSNTTALPLRYLHGWLFLIDASDVRAEIYDVHLRFRKDCFAILAGVFPTLGKGWRHQKLESTPREGLHHFQRDGFDALYNVFCNSFIDERDIPLAFQITINNAQQAQKKRSSNDS